MREKHEYQLHDTVKKAHQTHRDFHQNQKDLLQGFKNMQQSFSKVFDPFGLMSPIHDMQQEALDTYQAGIGTYDRLVKNYGKPEFDLNETKIGGKSVKVTEEKAISSDFYDLIRFKRDTDRNDPKLLIVSPMSGHFATLLRDTVETLLPDHDVYMVDWKDARDVPLDKGEFGLDTYIQSVMDCMKELGPDGHVMAVCQPTVAVLSAVSIMAANDDPNQPQSMTLMAGPLDTRNSQTEVNKFARSKSIDWFKDNLLARVPDSYEGAGRLVYPGYRQLTAFMAMNPDNHMKSFGKIFNALKDGDEKTLKKFDDFYDEYFAVADLDAKFYIETVEKVFKEHHLPNGKMTFNGQKVDPAKIGKTALFTVEGGKDDICEPGETIAVQDMCINIKSDRKFHYLQEGAGHYGVFSGSKFRENIAPRITGFIRHIANMNGQKLAPSERAKLPQAHRPKSLDQGRKSGNLQKKKSFKP